MTDNKVSTIQPWQVKFAYGFGIPAIIAMYLVYYQTDKMDQNQQAFNKSIIELKEEVRNLRDAVSQGRELALNTERKSDRLLNMMVRVCATTAETNVDRNACFELTGTSGTGGVVSGMKPYTRKPASKK